MYQLSFPSRRNQRWRRRLDMLDGRRNTEEGVKIVIGGQIFPRRARQLPPILRSSLTNFTRVVPRVHYEIPAGYYALRSQPLGRDIRRLICNSCYLEATFDPLPPQSGVPRGAAFPSPGGMDIRRGERRKGCVGWFNFDREPWWKEGCGGMRHADRERERRFMVIRNYRLAPRLVASLRNLFAPH